MRRDINKYKTPTIDEIKESQEYKGIVKRFERFVLMWEDLNITKQGYDKCKQEKGSANKECGEKGRAWLSKTSDLYNYVAEYLTEKGIETEKSKVVQLIIDESKPKIISSELN